MLRFLLSFLFLTSLMAHSQDISHQTIREMYFDGWKGACGAEDLTQLLEDKDIQGDPVLQAYQGAAITTLANCKKMPFSKLSVFNQGKDILERAIDKAPDNVEIRFLRYTVQTNIPDILNYNHKESDKVFLLESLNLHNNPDLADSDLRNRIIHYLYESGNLSEKEKQEVKQYIAGG